MKAVLLCGGLGTRLRPYTYKTPKSMLEVGGHPLLWYVIQNLKKNGITDFILNVGYLNEQIVDYFRDGKELGVNIEYSIEDEALNTAGSVFPLKEKLNETFVVMMGDQLTNVNIKAMIEDHKKNKSVATVGLLKHKIPLEYGVADLEGNKITGFREKPVLENYINTAIYVFEPEIFSFIKEKEDFAKNVLPRVIESGKPITGFILEGSWFDMGRVSDYERFNEEINMVKLTEDLQS